MLTINIICVGKLKEKYLKEAVEEYSKRLSKYCKLNIIELPDEKIPDKVNDAIIEEIKKKECSNIIKHISKDTYKICLDLRGKELTSEQFSENITTLSLMTSSITYIIGGSMGVTQELINICDKSISFSKMTFPHQLIRVFLLEQIFRGFKIANGETYHK